MRRTKDKSPKKALPWYGWLVIGLGIVVVVTLVRASPENKPFGSSDPGELKAAIVDQLYSLKPDEAFISEITGELEGYGFEIDLYQGDDVTVDLYRQLPSYGYELIIFRAHSGLLASKGEVTYRTCVFTNELYSQRKHVAEQLSHQLAMARITEHHPWVFAIGAKLVAHSMKGKFDDTAMIMMGCSCLYIEDLARSFIKKGASTYIGWDASVGLDYVDNATMNLIGNLCTKGMTLHQAVAKTIAQNGADPNYGAVLKYYPSQNGNQTLKQLIK